MADYRKLEVWQAARQLAVKFYALTASFQDRERYNLTSQLQRSAVSVVANIAEGSGRGTDLDFARFLRIALGSLSELSALLDLAEGLEILRPEQRLEDEIRDLQVRLTNLRTKLERDGGRLREDRAAYNVSEPSPAT